MLFIYLYNDTGDTVALISKAKWIVFGRWMMVLSGIACLSLVFGIANEIALFLKIWVGALGLYCIYLGLSS